MKGFILFISIFLCVGIQSQVFKSPADADVKAAVRNPLAYIISDTTSPILSSVSTPILGQINLTDILPLPKYKTTLSKDKIVSVTLLMTKPDGSIIVVDSAWRMGIRKDIDKISIIYPDSTRTVYRIMERDVEDTLLTIPFTISKKIFDEMQTIKLEIIR